MTEIRPIREAEAEDFLRLLCKSFAVEYERAYDPFFEEPYFDLDRKWALFEGQEIVSILTTTPLRFGWGPAFGIAGVATAADRRSEGHAARLIDRVVRHGERNGEPAALLFAQRTELYERGGFAPLDRVVSAPLPQTSQPPVEGELPIALVREMYDRWAAADPDRLRRDDRRWAFWRWNFRQPLAAGDGYLVHEGDALKEAVGWHGDTPPVPGGTGWLGLTVMADELGLVFETATVQLTLMGRNVPSVPKLWMTDAF